MLYGPKRCKIFLSGKKITENKKNVVKTIDGLVDCSLELDVLAKGNSYSLGLFQGPGFNHGISLGWHFVV